MKVRAEQKKWKIKGGGEGKTLLRFAWWGHKLAPTHTKSVKFHDFAELLYILVSFLQITFKLGNFSDFKVRFAN